MNNNIRRKGYKSTSDEPESESLLSGGDSFSMSSFHPKKREDSSPIRTKPDQTIECEIQPNDTLRTLSLKYNIPVAELKRVNNIIEENTFFALKRIKIPVKPNSFLPTLLAGVHSEDGAQGNGWYVSSNTEVSSFSSRDEGMSSRVSSGGETTPCSELEHSSVVYKTVSIGDTVLSESRDKKKAKRFLKDMDKDLERIREKQRNFNGVIVEETINSNETRIYPLKASQFHQDNSGCSNRSLACWCSIVTLLIIIVFCVLVSLMSIHHGMTEQEFKDWEASADGNKSSTSFDNAGGKT